MMKNFIWAIVGGIAILLASCGTKIPAKTTTITHSTQAGVDVQDVVDSRPIFHASETILTDLIHTKLEVRPDWIKQYLYGTATITAKPHFYTSDSLFLDAKGMEIHRVLLNGQQLNYSYLNDKLAIQLDRKYTHSEQYTVSINYTAKPNERFDPNDTELRADKGLFFINPHGTTPNQMPQIWTQGEIESSSVWFPTIDAPNAKTSQEILITVEDKYVTLSNGSLIESTHNTDGTRTDHWKQELPHAPYLFMLAVGEFKVVKDSFTRKDGTTIDVHYYVEPEWEAYAHTIFGETPRMLRYFSDLLGVEYPWDKYHQIVVRQYVSGAMENTGAVVFGDFVYRSDRESIDANSDAIIAHELFHHWFGDLVTCESWSNLALNEAFANYAQYLWDEYKYGKDEADMHASSQAEQYIQQTKMQGYHNLVWYDYDEKGQMFDAHSYNKGGRILHMLRNTIGDEAFFKSLQKYLTDNQYKAAEFHHLRLACEEITGQDLNWFFDQWFTDKGHPELTVSQEIQNGELVVKVVQQQNFFEMPIFKLPTQIAVVDSKGTNVYEVVIDKIDNEFKLPLNGQLQTVIFDYQASMLAQIKEEKPQDQFIRQYYHTQKWRDRNRALNLGTIKMTDQAQQLVLDALNDPFWQIRNNALEKAIRLKDENKQKAVEIIIQRLTKDPKSAVRVEVLNTIDRMNLPNREHYYGEALNDSSYNVVATALKFLGKVDVALAMEKALNLENEPSAKMIVGIGGLYAENGDQTKFEFFKKHLTNGKISGFDELGLMNIFTRYLAKQSVDLIQQAIPIYEHLQQTGSRYTRSFFIQNIIFLVDELTQRQTADKESSDKLRTVLAHYKKFVLE